MKHTLTIDVLRRLAEAHIGTSHAERMAMLILIDAEGPTPIGHVSQRIGMSKGAMTSIVDRLVAAKLVKRLPDHGDRRTTYLEATGLARQALRRAEQKAVS